MGCLIAILAALSPRLAIFVLWIATDVLSDAYDTWVLPLLGFLFLPWTALAFALMWVAGSDGVSWFGWIIVVLAFFADLGSYAGAQRSR